MKWGRKHWGTHRRYLLGAKAQVNIPELLITSGKPKQCSCDNRELGARCWLKIWQNTWVVSSCCALCYKVMVAISTWGRRHRLKLNKLKSLDKVTQGNGFSLWDVWWGREESPLPQSDTSPLPCTHRDPLYSANEYLRDSNIVQMLAC